MKKRFLALFLCCVMVFTLLPAALTTAFATGEADGEETAPAQETTDVVPGDTGDLDDEQQPDDEQPVACTCGAAEDAAHAEGCPLYVAPEQPGEDKQPDEDVVCTCGAAEGAAHAEDCPLYVNPEQPADEQDKQDEQPVVCTCGAAEGAAHAEDCPLYVAPEQGKDEQQPEEEQTDYTEVYEQLMAAETAEELDALLDSFADEAAMDEFLAWLDANDKRTALEEHIAALNEQETLEQEEDTAILPMVVPFTNVGPLLPATVLRRANAPMAVAANKDGNNGSNNNNNGLVLSKKAEPVAGGYKITMEAYATGQSTTTVSAKPADIVLVLDMSGSMEWCLKCGDSLKDHYEYVAVYDSSAEPLDTTKTYYIDEGYIFSNYKEVVYCEGNHDKRHNPSWVKKETGTSNHRINLITPKTSGSDGRNTQFYTYTRVAEHEFISRIDSLKTAVNGFINSVNEKSPDSKIAIVKFAGTKSTTVGNDRYNGGKYNYSQIVKNLTTVDAAGKTALQEAVTALSAGGATQADYGMQHAQSIIADDNTDHNKVVVMFTDGEPTSGSSFEDKVANAAITASKSIKDANATVYTIGVFAGADGTPVASLDSVNETNKYMHLVSSNYKNATSLTNPGTATYPEGGKSYYLSAADQGQLENIFQQISSETGGSSVQYGTETVIKDIVTPYFTMPANTTDIKLYTADSDGSTDKWKNWVPFSDGKVDIDKSTNTVSVTGFSFKDNWCGNHTGASGGTTFHNGKKLIIEFTVQPKAGFLGGNGVPTNGDTSGVYHNNQLVGEFPIPTVNVPIQPVTVNAVDKNVYLMGNVTEAECKNGASAMCNGVNLLNESEYTGANEWKADYVNITTTVTPPTGDLTDDGTYTINVKVEPEPLESGIVFPTGELATAKTGTATKNINVFKPELTFKDTEAYYGDTAPDYDTENLVASATKWTHKGTEASPATMIGTAPTLACEYAPEADKIVDGKINTPNDFGVKATVKIGDTNVTTHTTFVHTNCTGKTCTLPANYHFLIHVKTCTLTVKKELAAGTTADAGQRFIFTITYPDGSNQTVVVEAGQFVNITGLKIGTYTVTEDTKWSWRYTPDQKSYTAELSAESNNDTKTVTVTNKLDKNQWVTTDVYCQNKFEGSGTQTIVNDTPKTN